MTTQLANTKLTIVGATGRDLEDLLRGIGTAPSSAADLAAVAAAREKPDVVVLDVRGAAGIPPALAELTRQNSALGVVIVAARLDPAMMLEALQSGARGFVAMPLTADELRDAVGRVIAPAAGARVGRLFAFVGARGGVGTTTLAVNVASALARQSKGDTVLVDLNAGFADASMLLACEPRFTVVDALQNAQRLDEAFIRGLVVRSSAGLDLLAAPDQPVALGADQMRLRALLNFLKRQYAFTVLDVPRTDPAILDALDEATAIVLVVSQELTAVRNASRVVGVLKQRYGGERLHVAIAREDRAADIAPKDLEQTLGMPIRVFPSDYRNALEALNHGKPLILENHSRLASELGRFVRQISGVEAKPPVEKASMLPRWLRGGAA